MTRATCLLAVALTAALARAEAPVHHVLKLRLDPAARAVRGTDRVTLRAGAPAAFELATGLAVERLVVDGSPVPAAAGRRQVTLDLDPGRAVHEILVEYRGTLGATGDGDTTKPLAGPDGSFLPAGGWFPTFDAAFTYSVTVEVPGPQRALTSGRLMAESSDERGYRATFASGEPVAELSLFAGPYRIAEHIHRGWRLRTYLHASVADLSDTYLDRVQRFLDLYDGWIGTYPYPGFAVVSSPFPVGLGFPGITYMGTQVLRLPFIPDTSLGHEVLHSWWGSAVRPGAGGNWAEGLTTFMADYTYLETRGADAARAERLAWLREFAVLPAAEDRPLSAFQERSHTASQATGYHKAAFVFVMLRDEIGADAFTAGVRRFWQAHRFGSASWSDLGTAFARVSGMPLTAFFVQWVQRAGAPELVLRDVHADAARVTLTLGQTAPPYALAIPVMVDTASGSVTRRMRLDEISREYAFDVAGAHTLAVDPDLRVFRRLAHEEIPPIIRGVAFDAGAVTVIAAPDDAGRAAAREVAARLLEREPEPVAAGASLPPRPALVVGATTEVSALLAQTGEPAAPASLAGRGTARAWAAWRPGDIPLVVIAGDDAAALRAVAGPLPHYGGQSFVVFDGARAVDRGLWPPAASPLRVGLAP